MNSKLIIKKCANGIFMLSKDVFDYQVFRLIDCPEKQPDLKKMVRLFFDVAPSWSGPFMNIKKHFRIFHFLENEASLGSNRKKYEIRLSFYMMDEFPQGVILCFAISHFDMIGYLQSLYFRLLFYLMLPSMVRSINTYFSKTIPSVYPDK